MTAAFTRRIEDFTCAHCRREVKGTGYTNHCPRCLYSRHVDVNPGDRAAECGGMMAPIAAMLKGEQWIVMHECEACGHRRPNRCSPRDDRDLLIELMGRPFPRV
ncbi:RNHCP domain-containing protein [Actinorhabdospora filicis]|nr:RNHCP domain-containing protein [Actinorhabdospora filicis]